MNNSDDEIENINTKSSFDFDECYDLTMQDYSVQDAVSLYTHENDIDVIDCTVIPHIDLRDILDDVSALELDDIEDMMGHETKAETALYIHVSDDLKKQALETISIEGEYSWPFMYGGASQLSC